MWKVLNFILLSPFLVFSLQPQTLSLNRTVEWPTNGEGLYSHLVKLKFLRYFMDYSGSRRTILVRDFTSVHYKNSSMKIRICDILDLSADPDLDCVLEHYKQYEDHEYMEVFDSDLMKEHEIHNGNHLILLQNMMQCYNDHEYDLNLFIKHYLND
jgi:hypothetical protein